MIAGRQVFKLLNHCHLYDNVSHRLFLFSVLIKFGFQTFEKKKVLYKRQRGRTCYSEEEEKERAAAAAKCRQTLCYYSIKDSHHTLSPVLCV